MIHRFIKVIDGLYRGSCPEQSDVINLYKQLGIRKIVSLDGDCGKKINKVCKILGIKHITIPIDGTKLEPLAKLLSYDLYDLLMKDGPTYVHCLHGKDRTGMVIAMFQCKYMHISCKEAIKQAKKIGFGLGVEPKTIALYEKMIHMACKEKCDHAANVDTNNADIVDNTREKGDYVGSVLDSASMPSFAPFMTGDKWYPYSPTYNSNDDQYPTRNNIDLEMNYGRSDTIQSAPLVGIFDEPLHGAGPIEKENFSGT